MIFSIIQSILMPRIARSMPRVDADEGERLIPIAGTPVDMLNPPGDVLFTTV